jgi:hypothetical protein
VVLLLVAVAVLRHSQTVFLFPGELESMLPLFGLVVCRRWRFGHPLLRFCVLFFGYNYGAGHSANADWIGIVSLLLTYLVLASVYDNGKAFPFLVSLLVFLFLVVST